MIVWLIIAIVIIVVFLVVWNRGGGFKAYAPPTVNQTTLEAQYTPTNPWGVNGSFNPPSVPVDGDKGICAVYTFPARGRFEPSFIKMTDVESDGSVSQPQLGQVCVDVDQIFAQKKIHECQPNPTGWDIRTSGKCRTQDGKLVDPGVKEEFYTFCTPQGVKPQPGNALLRCPGSLSLVAFGVDIQKPGPTALDSGVCMSIPDYSISVGTESGYVNTSPINMLTCDMRPSYQGFARQLFRIQRAVWDGKKYVFNQSGSFVKIIHRATGLELGPKLTVDATGRPIITKPILGQPVDFYRKETWGDVYPWVLTPQLTDPKFKPGDKVMMIARQQLVYAPRAKSLPGFGQTDKLWTYLTTRSNMVPSLQVDSANHLNLGLFITVDGNASPSGPGQPDPQAPSKLAVPMFIDYDLAQMITTDPSKFIEG